MATRMRAKVYCEGVSQHGGKIDPETKKSVPGVGCETVVFRPIAKSTPYGEDGLDEDNTFAKFSPSGRFELSITNPALHGGFQPNEKYYVDFTPVDA